MMAKPAGAVGPTGGWRTRGGAACAAVALLAVACLGGCGGSLSHRSVDEASTRVPIGPEVKRVRIEVQNGSVGVDQGAGAEAEIAVGVRRAADSEEELRRLEQVPFQLQPTSDPERPGVLILRGPSLPDGSQGLLALELGIRLPAALELEVLIRGNGHVVVANRRAAVQVETGRGDLRFEYLHGAVKARTGRGNVIAIDHRGPLDIVTMVGDMQAFVREPDRAINLATGHGTVQCLIPEGLGFEVDARAEVGRIRNRFGVPVERDGYRASMVGRHGTGGPTIVLRTGQGDLSLAGKQW